MALQLQKEQAEKERLLKSAEVYLDTMRKAHEQTEREHQEQLKKEKDELRALLARERSMGESQSELHDQL